MNTNQSLQLKILSPDKIIFDQNIDMVVIPGSEGEFAVLVNHEHMVAEVKFGIVNIYKEDLIIDTFIISDGIAQVTGKTCIIAVENALSINEINQLNIQNMLIAAKNALDIQVANQDNRNLSIEFLRQKINFLQLAMDYSSKQAKF